MLVRLNFILKLRIFIYKTRNKISIILNYIFRIPFLFIPSPYPPRTKSTNSIRNEERSTDIFHNKLREILAIRGDQKPIAHSPSPTAKTTFAFIHSPTSQIFRFYNSQIPTTPFSSPSSCRIHYESQTSCNSPQAYSVYPVVGSKSYAQSSRTSPCR